MLELDRNSINSDEARDLERVGYALASAAGEAILPYFRGSDLDTVSKEIERYDPVTNADRAAERAMRNVLTTLRPQDGVLGEEFGTLASESGLTWVLDPIDGTRGFVSGTPTWGTLIALSDEQGPLFGIIDQPYIKERFVGGLGQAFASGPLGQRALNTAQNHSLSNATLFTTFPEVGSRQDFLGFRAVAEKVKLVRYGMDCYAYALLAAGQIDLVIEAGLSAYDIQAPIAVIEAAGGVVTDWRGESAHHGGQCVAAANDALLNEVLPLLKPFSEPAK